MKQIIETRMQGNETPNILITIQMLKGMIDALDQYDAEWRIAETKPVSGRCYPDQGPAIDFSLDDEFDSDNVSEHTAIMVPQNELEGIFSIAEHLGEGIRPEIFNVNGSRIQTNGAGLTNVEKIIYYEAGQTAQGAAVLPHEDRSRRPWYLYAGGIRQKFNTTQEQAESLAHSFKVLDTTSRMAMQFAKWIDKSGVEKAVGYFSNMASELLAVAPDEEPLDLIAYEESDDEIDADHPAEIETILADAYHLLDDPRDAEDYPTWESLQPASFRFELSRVRTSKTLDGLKAWAKAQYGKTIDKFTKPQTQVLWDAYKIRKAALTPPLSAFAKKVIKRLSEPGVNIRRVKYWLYNEGPAKLNPTELANAWQVIKAKEAVIPNGV